MKPPALPCSLRKLWLIALAPLSSLAWEPIVRLEYDYTQNVGLASAATDFINTGSLGFGLTAQRARQLAPSLLMLTGLEGEIKVTPDYSRLNEATIGPQLGFRRRFGLGPSAPTITGELAMAGRLAQLGERTGWGGRTAVAYTHRLNRLLAIALRGETERRWSRGDVYDTRHRSVVGEIALDPHPRVRFTTGYGHLRGLMVAGAAGARFAAAQAGAFGPEIAWYYNRIPVSINEVFARDWTSYRVRAEVDFWYFEFSPALTERSALALRYERDSAVNFVSVPYHRDRLTLSWLHAF